MNTLPEKGGASSHVYVVDCTLKWGPHVSSSFPIKQSVRQGGILSMTHYKLFNSGLLHTTDESGLDASIGCFKCGVPTCADDVAVLGDRVFHVRCIVEIVRGYCCLEHCTIHPQKSEEVVLNCEKDSQSEVEIRIGPRQANLSLIAYASSEGSGEPAHPRSLARTSAARSYRQ